MGQPRMAAGHQASGAEAEANVRSERYRRESICHPDRWSRSSSQPSPTRRPHRHFASNHRGPNRRGSRPRVKRRPTCGVRPGSLRNPRSRPVAIPTTQIQSPQRSPVPTQTLLIDAGPNSVERGRRLRVPVRAKAMRQGSALRGDGTGPETGRVRLVARHPGESRAIG